MFETQVWMTDHYEIISSGFLFWEVILFFFWAREVNILIMESQEFFSFLVSYPFYFVYHFVSCRYNFFFFFAICLQLKSILYLLSSSTLKILNVIVTLYIMFYLPVSPYLIYYLWDLYPPFSCTLYMYIYFTITKMNVRLK